MTLAAASPPQVDPRDRSKKTLRVDVHLEPEIAFALGRCGNPAPQIGREIKGARSLHEQPKAMPAAHNSEWRFRWSKHAHLLGTRRGRSEAARKQFRRRAFPRRHDEAREPRERRIVRLLSQFDL